MYLLRFKRHKQAHVFLVHSFNRSAYRYILETHERDACHFDTLEKARTVVTELSKLEIPKKALEFDETTLFLMQLYGSTWNDSVEGMVLDMDDVIKAQILEQKTMQVVETIRMRNPIWEKHYA